MVVVGKCKCLWNFKVFISMNTATTTTHSAIDECTLITCRHRKILVPLSSPAEIYRPAAARFVTISISLLHWVPCLEFANRHSSSTTTADCSWAKEQIKVQIEWNQLHQLHFLHWFTSSGNREELQKFVKNPLRRGLAPKPRPISHHILWFRAPLPLLPSYSASCKATVCLLGHNNGQWLFENISGSSVIHPWNSQQACLQTPSLVYMSSHYKFKCCSRFRVFSWTMLNWG